jgi:hypothetical protein
MRIAITIFLTLFVSILYSQNEFSLYFNNIEKIWNINREIKICQQDDYLFIDKGDINIEVSTIGNNTRIFFENELVGDFLTKSFISEEYIVIFFIKSKTYYYIYTN